MDNINKLVQMISESNKIVAFTGAGVSTESGIPDFRSSNGLFSRETGQNYTFEKVLSKDFFYTETEMFYKFYKEFLLFKDAKPNDCHKALVKLEKSGKLNAVITQNIDNLHSDAGSKSVIELHGNANRNYCTNCNKVYDRDFIFSAELIPKCVDCGGIIKPDVVLYGEMLDEEKLFRAKSYIRQADVLAIMGTSLVVYPAANLVKYYEGDRLVLVNMSHTPYDYMANLIIHEKAGTVMNKVLEILKF